MIHEWPGRGVEAGIAAMSEDSQKKSEGELDLFLKRIQRRQRFLKTLRSLEGALSLSLVAAALLILADRVYEPLTTTDQKVGAAAVLFLLSLLISAIRSKSTSIAGAVEVEKNTQIPQTISTAIYAREGKLTENTSRKVIEDAGEVSSSIDLAQALPIRSLRPGKVLWLCVSFFAVSLFIPPLDLLGTQASEEKDRKESARVLRKEKALVRRLEKVEEISKKHEVSEEVQEVIRKVAEQQKKNLEAAKSSQAEKRTAENLQDQLNQQKSKIAEARKNASPETSRDSVNRLKEGLEAMRQKSSPEMRRLAKALQEDDPGQIATALEALAKKLSSDPEALKGMQKELQKLLGRKAGKNSKPGENDLKGDGLVNDLEQLSRMLKDMALLDQMKEQLDFTEAELSQLAKDWPKGDPPKICPDCLAGKCDANSGGT